MSRNAAAVFAVTIFAVVVRLLTASQCTYGSDPVNYALALSKFDVRIHQPQPPGVLWFILLAQAMRPLAGDAHRALIYANLLGSAACVALAYLLAAQVFASFRAGLTAAVLIATSPLMWFYGSLGQSCGWEAFNALLGVNVAWRAMRFGTLGWAMVLSGALGLIAGLRPADVVFFVPLWVLVVWRCREPLAAAAVGLPLIAAGIAAWLVPTALMSGGWHEYAAALRQQASAPSWLKWNNLAPLAIDAKNTVAWTTVGLGAAAFAALWLLWRGRAAIRQALGSRPGAGAFWAAAIIPASAFYVFGHVGQAGYVLTVVPLLIVLVAGALDIAARSGGARSFAFAVGTCAAANCAFFLLAMPLPVRMADTWSLPSWRLRLERQANRSMLDFTWAEIRDHDALCRKWQSYARGHFAREDTAFVGEYAPGRRVYSREMVYYLGQYAILGLAHDSMRHTWYFPNMPPRAGGRRVLVPSGIKRLVWLVEDLPPRADAATRALFIHRATLLGRARQMVVLELPASRLPVSYLGFRLTRARPEGRRAGGES